MAHAISLAKELKDTHALAVALHYAALLGHFERNPAQVERLASDLIELSTRQHFATWLPGGAVLRGWARSASGDIAESMAWIEEGIKDWRATGATMFVPYYLGLKAEALHSAARTSEALEAIFEAEALAERSEGVGGVQNCTGSAVCFLWHWVRRRPKLRPRFANRSQLQRSRSRFR